MSRHTDRPARRTHIGRTGRKGAHCEWAAGRSADCYPAHPMTSIWRLGPDLLVLGGTVVTAARSRRADIAVRGGVIEAIEADLSSLAPGARDVVRADELLVLPGCVDVHTHTRVASENEPDRFWQD